MPHGGLALGRVLPAQNRSPSVTPLREQPFCGIRRVGAVAPAIFRSTSARPRPDRSDRQIPTPSHSNSTTAPRKGTYSCRRPWQGYRLLATLQIQDMLSHSIFRRPGSTTSRMRLYSRTPIHPSSGTGTIRYDKSRFTPKNP